MQYLSAISNAAVAVHSGIGHVVNFPMDSFITALAFEEP